LQKLREREKDREKMCGLEEFHRRFQAAWGEFTPEEVARVVKAQDTLLDSNPVKLVESNNRAQASRCDMLIARHQIEVRELQAEASSAQSKVAASKQELLKAQSMLEACRNELQTQKDATAAVEVRRGRIRSDRL
jgi:uncharacterized protein YlxW (UPF0749 family)